MPFACNTPMSGCGVLNREIEHMMLLELKSPEIYDDIAGGTRCKFESNQPHAILFEGPTGTASTTFHLTIPGIL
jgi:hypothetical protein